MNSTFTGKFVFGLAAMVLVAAPVLAADPLNSADNTTTGSTFPNRVNAKGTATPDVDAGWSVKSVDFFVGDGNGAMFVSTNGPKAGVLQKDGTYKYSWPDGIAAGQRIVRMRVVFQKGAQTQTIDKDSQVTVKPPGPPVCTLVETNGTDFREDHE